MPEKPQNVPPTNAASVPRAILRAWASLRRSRHARRVLRLSSSVPSGTTKSAAAVIGTEAFLRARCAVRSCSIPLPRNQLATKRSNCSTNIDTEMRAIRNIYEHPNCRDERHRRAMPSGWNRLERRGRLPHFPQHARHRPGPCRCPGPPARDGAFRESAQRPRARRPRPRRAPPLAWS